MHFLAYTKPGKIGKRSKTPTTVKHFKVVRTLINKSCMTFLFLPRFLSSDTLNPEKTVL